MKSRRGDSGFSLVQVLVAAGMMGALALGVMQITQNISQTLTHAQSVQDQISLFSEIESLLNHPDHCRVSLGGEDFMPSKESFRKSRLNVKEKTETFSLELYQSTRDGKKRKTKRLSATDPSLRKYGNITIENLSLSFEDKSEENFSARHRHVENAFIDVEISRPLSMKQNRMIQKSFPVQLTLQTSSSGDTKIVNCAGLDTVMQEQAVCENAGRFYLPERNPPCSVTMNKVNELAPLGIAQGSMGHLRCPEGFGVTGLSGSTQRNKVSQIKIHCEPIQKGSLTPDENNPYGSPFVGNPQGLISNSICEAGLWANGLRVDLLNGVAGIGVNCVEYGKLSQTPAKTIGSSSRLSNVANCEKNTILREVAVYYTDKIEALRGACW